MKQKHIRGYLDAAGRRDVAFVVRDDFDRININALDYRWCVTLISQTAIASGHGRDLLQATRKALARLTESERDEVK